jgi:hypothetical protein
LSERTRRALGAPRASMRTRHSRAHLSRHVISIWNRDHESQNALFLLRPESRKGRRGLSQAALQLRTWRHVVSGSAPLGRYRTYRGRGWPPASTCCVDSRAA